MGNNSYEEQPRPSARASGGGSVDVEGVRPDEKTPKQGTADLTSHTSEHVSILRVYKAKIAGRLRSALLWCLRCAKPSGDPKQFLEKRIFFELPNCLALFTWRALENFSYKNCCLLKGPQSTLLMRFEFLRPRVVVLRGD